MLISELIKISLSTLKANRLRAMLTLSGIVIGVFSIIAIMTLLNALQAGIEGSLSGLGSNTFQIQKFPVFHAGGAGEDKKYRNRPQITYEQGIRLKEKATLYKYISLEDYIGDKTLKSSKISTNPNYTLAGVTPEYLECNNKTVSFGRFLTQTDLLNNRKVAVLTIAAADKLFPHTDPINQYITVDNSEFLVIGIFAKEGGGAIGGRSDNYAMLPITTVQQIYGKNSRSLNIAIQARSKETYDETVENVVAVMRSIQERQTR